MKINKSFVAPSALSAVLAALLVVLTACSSGRTAHRNVPLQARGIENACDILTTHPAWRNAFIETYRRHGVPPHVVMAIIYQESRFKHNAKAKTSSAFGYPQAKTATWNWYRDKTGKRRVYRDYLPDAVDFIGWYLLENHRRTQVSKWDARNQYLAYHEGTGGYLRNSHGGKQWLLAVADKVDHRARRYRAQLARCFQYPNG